jgi:hypothetical protein
VDGQKLGPGTLAESLTFLNDFSYSQIRNALLASAISTDQVGAAGTLPIVDPIGGNYWLSTAEAKALGLLPADSSADGFVGFSSTAPLAYDPNNRAVPGEFDFIGIVAHEISEVLGSRCWANSPRAILPRQATAMVEPLLRIRLSPRRARFWPRVWGKQQPPDRFCCDATFV